MSNAAIYPKAQISFWSSLETKKFPNRYKAKPLHLEDGQALEQIPQRSLCSLIIQNFQHRLVKALNNVVWPCFKKDLLRCLPTWTCLWFCKNYFVPDLGTSVYYFSIEVLSQLRIILIRHWLIWHLQWTTL